MTYRRINNHKTTPEMASRIAYIGQLGISFEESECILKELTGITASKTLIRQITEEVGELIYNDEKETSEMNYIEPEKAIPYVKEKEKSDDILYILPDGSAVNTRIVEDGTSWKEMKLGLVYSTDNIVKYNTKRTEILSRRYTACFGNVEKFKPLLFNAAIESGYGTYKDVVMVGDGAHWIWNMCDEIFPDAVQILDFYHMSENVYNYAKYLYPNNENKKNKWAKKTIDLIESSKSKEALRRIPAVVEKLPLGVVNLRTYIKNNINRIKYPLYKEKGYIIGSGAIESGNKKVIQHRMKQSGMRWGIKTGQAIASLRAEYASGRWAEVTRRLAA